VTIKFGTKRHVAGFECALDSTKFEECHYPFRAHVSVGKHVFLVRGVLKDGTVDPTPVKVK
jgi:hypothetical protein